jgi:hypothetical protein
MAIKITAAPGQRVRDEQSNLLPAEGITLDKITPYWVRRQSDEEIVIEEVKPAPPPAPAPRKSDPDR